MFVQSFGWNRDVRGGHPQRFVRRCFTGPWRSLCGSATRVVQTIPQGPHHEAECWQVLERSRASGHGGNRASDQGRSRGRCATRYSSALGQSEGYPPPSVMEEKLFPQERVQHRTVVHVPVPQLLEETVGMALVPHEQVLEETRCAGWSVGNECNSGLVSKLTVHVP